MIPVGGGGDWMVLQFVLGDLNYRLGGLESDAALHHIADSGKSTIKATQSHCTLDFEGEPSSQSDDLSRRGIWQTPFPSSLVLSRRGESADSFWLSEHYEKFHHIGHHEYRLPSPQGPPSWSRIGRTTAGVKLTEVPVIDEAEEGDHHEEEMEDEEPEEEKYAQAIIEGGVQEKDTNNGHVAVEIEGTGVSLSSAASPLGSPLSKPSSWSLRSIWKHVGSDRRLMSKGEEPTKKVPSSLFKRGHSGLWEWIASHDELMMEMTKGEVFWGFKEGQIAFPPSFRWKPKTFGGGFDQVS